MKKQLTAAVMGKDQAKAKQEIELNSFERSMQTNGFYPRAIPRVEEKFIILDPNELRADELQDAYQILLSIERYTYLVFEIISCQVISYVKSELIMMEKMAYFIE